MPILIMIIILMMMTVMNHNNHHDNANRSKFQTYQLMVSWVWQSFPPAVLRALAVYVITTGLCQR